MEVNCLTIYSINVFLYNFRMDADLYDEFGNYIGPELESDEEEDDDEIVEREPEQRDYDVSKL